MRFTVKKWYRNQSVRSPNPSMVTHPYMATCCCSRRNRRNRSAFSKVVETTFLCYFLTENRIVAFILARLAGAMPNITPLRVLLGVLLLHLLRTRSNRRFGTNSHTACGAPNRTHSHACPIVRCCDGRESVLRLRRWQYSS